MADRALGAEVWRGGVNTWECDEMGHMNVRFYVARAQEGLIGLAAALGLPEAFSPHGRSTLIVREHHVRFLKEARAGQPLHMTGGVLALTETGAELLQVLWHSGSGEPCASFLTRVIHAAPKDGRAFPWPRRTEALADAIRVEAPPFAAPRGIAPGPVESRASLARADALGLSTIGAGGLLPSDCDAFGRMRAEQFIGRVSDGIPALLAGLREEVAARAAEPVARVGGAVLEYRLLYLDWPRAGDRLVLRSGLAGFDAKTQRMNHWLLDPATGRAWGTSEAVAVSFDLDRRRAIAISEAARPALQAHVVDDLGY